MKKTISLKDNPQVMNYYYLCIVMGLTSLVAIAAVILSSSRVMADSSVSSVTLTVDPACSFTASGGIYSNTIIGGQTDTITADPIMATCNDASGYAVYAIGYSGDTYTGDYHTDMISNTLGNSHNIKTNGTNGASYWKMKLQDLSDATIANSYDSFQVIPASFTKVASYASNTTTGSFTPVYEIHIETNQPADTYTGKVKYTLVHPNTMVAGTYTVAYNANSGSGSMSNSTGIYNFEEFTIPAGSFTAPTGYIFAGWCTTNTAGSYACDGTSYAAGDKVTSLATAGSTTTLYAYWEKAYMQSFTLANCPADGMIVYDKRDENDYTVKLINGQCWMTQNLRYLGDSGSPAGTMVIGGNDSHAANKSVDLYSLKSSDAGNFGAYADHCDDTNGYNYACVYDSGSTSTGVWYNFYAASAGTIDTNSNSTAASSDICPAGWHLPTGPSTTANTDFNKLIGNTTSGWQSATTGLTAFNAISGGNYKNGSLSSTAGGLWWSAIAYAVNNRFGMDYNSNNGQFYGGGSYDRYYGFFVRCVKSS